jgi:hypothetical protein
MFVAQGRADPFFSLPPTIPDEIGVESTNAKSNGGSDQTNNQKKNEGSALFFFSLILKSRVYYFLN